jgi:hypothetical protein
VIGTCRGFKRSGEHCAATVEPPQEFCWWHNPANAEQRSRAASKAAKAKGPSTDIVEVKQQLRTIAADVLEGKLDKGTGSVAAQVLGVWARVTEVERKVRELDEISERLLALEQAAEARRGVTWGA